MDAAFDDEGEPAVTIGEYLDAVEERELEADLILGGDDGKECTYSKGYMKRQAIFSCITCTPDGNAGICTACSLSCHDGHQIVELWTKRNFRCDCGNSKFGELYCKIFPNKDVENVENSYNHNFKGLYCTCGHLYPDPDAEEQVDMIQCCLCEDWFHEEHLGLEPSVEIPRDEEGEPLYEDFICKTCSEVCFFLKLYPEGIWAAAKQPGATGQVSKDKGILEDEPSTCGLEKPMGDSSKSSRIDTAQTSVDSGSISDEKSLPQGGDCNNSMALNQCTESMNSHVNCLLGVNLVAASPVTQGKPLFLSKSWRDALCKCNNCLEYYNQKRIAFLLDKEDTIAEYEKMAKQKREENLQQQEGDELSFFNKLGHVAKVEILKGIEDLKDGLRTRLTRQSQLLLMISTSFLMTLRTSVAVSSEFSLKGGSFTIMGNCMETYTMKPMQEEEEDDERTSRDDDSKGKNNGQRMKIVLTKEELKWLILQLNKKEGITLEQLLEEIERGRQKIEGWKPSLESIIEAPEILE